MQASNEELLASNEELQSTNEELHSVNEELYTVNAEYERKIKELTQLSADEYNLLRSTKVGTVFLDRDLRIRKFTPAIALSFNLLPLDIGRPIDHISYNVVDHVGLIDDVRKTLKTGEAFEREVRNRQGDVLLMRILPYLSDADTREGVVLTFVDITEMVAIKEKFRRSQLLLEEAGDIASIGGWEYSLDDQKIILTRQVGEILEIETGREIEFDQILTHFTERSAKELKSHIVILSHEGGSFVLEAEIITSKGKNKHVSMKGNFQPIKESRGRIYGIIQDTTMLKKAEEEKSVLEEQLHQSQKMEAIGRLAGGVAHDFNNLLTGIQGYAELLLSNTDKENQNFEAVEEIRKAAERAASLTQQLLAFSRKQVIAPRPLNLNDLVEESVKMIERIIGEDIQLTLSMAPNLKSVEVDPHQFNQVLMNLIINARDAMPEGGRLKIRTENKSYLPPLKSGQNTIAAGEYVMLEISDDGIGMDEELQKHIYEPFFTTKERGKGTGLGLATVFGIVNQNRGAIEIDSNVGQGTAFKIYLPIATEKPETKEVKVGKIFKQGCEIILLVEDEQMVRNLGKKILETYGYTVITAESGEQAFDIVKTMGSKFDLLLTDIIMPKMNGVDLFMNLKKIKSELRVLFMSGYTDDVIATRGVLEKNTNFIQKPFTLEGLAEKVREVLDTDLS